MVLGCAFYHRTHAWVLQEEAWTDYRLQSLNGNPFKVQILEAIDQGFSLEGPSYKDLQGHRGQS
jgi:hypothetical protein